MIITYYTAAFVLALVLSAVYVFMWHKHSDVNFTIIFTLIPISCLGSLLLASSTTLEMALTAKKVEYIGGGFLQLFIMLCIFNLCKMEMPRWGRTLLFLLSAVIFSAVLTIGKTDIFYRSVQFETVDGVGVLSKVYGPMHYAFFVTLIGCFVAGILAILYSLFKRKWVPRRILLLLLVPDAVCIIGYVIGRNSGIPVELNPAGYVLAEFMFLFIMYRVNIYDVADTVIDSMTHEHAIGYVSFDYKRRYLGSNSVARRLLPALDDVAVDKPIQPKTPLGQKIAHYLDSYLADKKQDSFAITVHGEKDDPEEERIYNAKVMDLYNGRIKCGFLITFTDDTQNRKYIQLLDSYNEDLQNQVDEKTKHIVEMHDNLIMSLAMMVESRDNSTGGHIKRTSDGMRILVDELKKEGTLKLSASFCRDVIKAAPMHDLGKIAVDDAVLRKPGRFTDEEFEKMKHHAAEGARVIHEILLHTDDESFKKVAENVAHYHHERWDGSGYPEGIAGEEIPLEARIMAIADVYDALVSKRVYKEAFSFEKADTIIMEGMGTQFDPGLKNAYVNAKPRLEAYYSSL